MKKIIRKWLGIKDLEVSKFVTKADIRHCVVEAVEAVFNETPESYTWWDEHYFIRGTVRREVERATMKHINKLAKDEFNELVKPEDFIDAVVARIKSKQLSG